MELLFLKEVDSTNKYAKENISQIKDATLVYADVQTAGRGRMARSWNFMSGENVYASIVLKPSSELKEVYSNLTQYLCVVLAEVSKSIIFLQESSGQMIFRLKVRKFLVFWQSVFLIVN